MRVTYWNHSENKVFGISGVVSLKHLPKGCELNLLGDTAAYKIVSCLCSMGQGAKFPYCKYAQVC